MEQLIQTLLTMTATASVAAVCVMVLRLPLKRAPRWIPCCLWLVVFLRMVCPTGLSLPVSLVPQAISNGASLERVLPPAQQAAPSAAPEEAVPEATPTASGETSVSVVHTAIPAETTLVWPVVLTGIWAAGGVAALLWAVLSYGRLRRRIADAVLIEENIYETDQIDTPFVCGFFRPRIYLPAGLGGEDRRYVLLHEQAHIRRGDHLMKPLAYLALCAHWFNPILWLSYRLLCRDIETACDQAVIRSFDGKDTLQYAEALLHLGHGPSLPAVVPLAFGEEDAKGRVRSVLSYKQPAFWLVVTSVAACVVTGVLLLADRAAPPAQLEGREITQATVVETLLSGKAWAEQRKVPANEPCKVPTNVPLSQDLTRDLTDLLAQADFGNFVSCPAPEDLPDRAVTLSSPDGPATYYLLEEGGELVLYRVLPTAPFPCQRAVLADGLAGSQAYADWKAKVEYYLAIGRAEDLYALKVSHRGKTADIEAILDAFCVEDAVGPYTLSFQTEEEPYSIVLNLERPPANALEWHWIESYFKSVSLPILALIDNVQELRYVYPPNTQVEADSVPYTLSNSSVRDSTPVDSYSFETFRTYFTLRHDDLSPYFPGKPTGRCYAVKEFTVLPDSDFPEFSQEMEDLYRSTLKVVLRRDYFAIRLGDGSETGYPDTTINNTDSLEKTQVELHRPDFSPGGPSDISFPVAPEGATETYQVWDQEDHFTGYCYYFQDDSLFLAYYPDGGQADLPLYVAELTLAPS